MEIDKEAFNNLKDKVEVQEFRISDSKTRSMDYEMKYPT